MTPLIVNDFDGTLDTKVIHGTVYFSHTGAGFDKRFFPIKLCFYQHGIQPSIAYIFLDTGKRIADVEKQAYEYYVIFFENIGIVQT